MQNTICTWKKEKENEDEKITIHLETIMPIGNKGHKVYPIIRFLFYFYNSIITLRKGRFEF